MSSERLATKTSRSAAWLYGQRLMINLIQLGAVAVLARQLDPADFGVVTLADVLIRFGIVFGNATVSNYVIYDRKPGWEERAQAAFWLNLVMISGITVIFILVTPWITRFYQEPLLGPVLIITLITFLLSQLSTVPDALIRRQFDYRKLVIRNGLLQLISAILSVGMALSGWGVWSLAVPGLLVAFPRFIIVMWMARWKPSLPLRIKHWGEVFSYTKHIIGVTILGELNSDGDTLVIGKLVGSAGLAIYDRAWRTSNLITKNITWVVSDVAMPAFSSLSSRQEALQRAYQRMLRILAITSFPLLIGMFVMAEEFILVLYGSKWTASVTPLRIFLIYALQRSVGSPSGVIYNSLGRPDLGLKINLVVLPFYFGSIFLGSLYGINGIAASVTIVKTISGLAAIYIASRLVGLSSYKILKTLWPPFENALIVGLTALGTKIFLSVYFPLSALSTLLICTFLGGLIFLLLLVTRYTSQLDEILFVLDSFSMRLSKPIRAILHRWEKVVSS
jgi:O-antigen/teichoic acid export membrane protein